MDDPKLTEAALANILRMASEAASGAEPSGAASGTTEPETNWSVDWARDFDGLSSGPDAMLGQAGRLAAAIANAPGPNSGWTDAYVFGLMIAILLWRPTGLAKGSEGAHI